GAAGRQVVRDLAAVPVGDANLDLVEAVEDVELGERDPRNAADLDRLAHHHGVEPAAAPLASGHHADLPAAPAQALTDLAPELGREWAAADARGVGLGDTEHETDAR